MHFDVVDGGNAEVDVDDVADHVEGFVGKLGWNRWFLDKLKTQNQRRWL